MANNTTVVESTLKERLAETLNAEIDLGTVSNIESAIKWIQSTFYYIRLKKNPKVNTINK